MSTATRRPRLSIDVTSETLNNNHTTTDITTTSTASSSTTCTASTTYSSSIQVPSIKGYSSIYSCTPSSAVPGHSSQLSSASCSNDTPTCSSYAKSSKLDLTIKLANQESISPPVKQSVTPLTPNTKQQFTFNEAANNEEDDQQITTKSYKLTVEQNTPTPTMKKATPSVKSKEFPATEPVMDSIIENEEDRQSNHSKDDKDCEEEILGKFGYIKTKLITKTLQGNIFIAQHTNTKDSSKEVVIKKTSKKLHNEHVTVQNGKKFGIYENILKECIILKYLTENKNGLIMTSFTKYENFFDDSDNYYLSMEHGGSDLFDFIIDAHDLINQKKLKMKEWRKFAKYLFWQMIVVLKWLHVDMNICHLDISLENILCKNATFIPLDDSKDPMFTINPNVQIKICDFGLAEIFNAKKKENAFRCTKYCGKTNYKAPQVYGKKKVFDARKADIWSLGVVLFCMLVGSPPYNRPVDSDQAYLYIKNGIIDQLLFQWERNHFITVKVLSLLHCMLCYDESKRYLVEDVIAHPWLSLYYHKYKHQMAKKSQLQQEKNKRCKPRLPFYKLPNNATTITNISH
eukprot:38834_1